MIIRQATKEDAAGILTIYTPYVLSTAFTFEKTVPTRSEMADHITKINCSHLFLVSVNQKVVTGYTYASRHRSRQAYDTICEVSVYIHDQYKSAGVGSRLYALLFLCLARMGFHTALAGITIPNDPSESFHNKFGFKAFADYANVGFKNGAWHDTRWLRKDLKSFNMSPDPIVPFNSIKDEQEIQSLFK